MPENYRQSSLDINSRNQQTILLGKTNQIINNFGNGNASLFMYYAKTLLLLPNKQSKGKDKLYSVLPQFALENRDKASEIEDLLLKIGASNIIIDSERALVALAKIKKEVE